MDRDGRAAPRPDGGILTDVAGGAGAAPGDPRYERLLAATRDAAQHGYDAVQMRDLAAASRLSLATVYRYCSSKDHLIAEAHVDWLGRFRAQLTRRPPTGADPGERVAAVLRQMCRSLERHRELTLTILRALYAPEPAVQRSRKEVGATYAAIIDDAIGPESVTDRATAIAVIGHVVDSVLARWAAGSMTAAEGADLLERTARLVLSARSRRRGRS